MDLWNYGILNVISSSIEEKDASPCSKSKYCKMFSSFRKKCRYLCELDSLKVFIPIIFFFMALFPLLEDLLETVDLRSSSLSEFFRSKSLYLFCLSLLEVLPSYAGCLGSYADCLVSYGVCFGSYVEMWLF